MLSLLLSLLFLGSLSALGIALLRSIAPSLTRLEVLSYGSVLGAVLGTILILGLADALGLTVAVVLVGIFSLAGAVIFAPRVEIRRDGWRRRTVEAVADVRDRHGTWVLVVIGLAVARLALMWSGMLTIEPDGLWANHVYIWGDWSVHLGDTTAFAYGDNFPPMHPRLADTPLAYHYLISLTAAGMVVLGMDPTAALPLQSFLYSVILVLALYAFGLRVTGDRAIAAVGLVLFLLGGSLGWILLFDPSAGGPIAALAANPWDYEAQQDANFWWFNPYFALIMSQRAALYGIPLVLLVLTVLLGAVRSSGWRAWAIAGLIAGFLPLAHLGSFAALGLITPVLVLLFPRRGWAIFFGVWIVVGGAFLFGVQGGEARSSSGLRWDPGWLTGEDPWPWFWLKNLGLYLPLGAVGLLTRRLLPADGRRMLLAFLPIFVVANTFILSVFRWDNSKILLYFFLALALLAAAAVVALWRVQRDLPSRILIGVAVLTMIGSGLLTNYGQALGFDRIRMLGTADLELAAWARDETDPRAVFAVGLEHTDPIPMLAGRRAIASYRPWLTSIGLDASAQEADLRTIMALDPDAESLIREYGIDYVEIGSWEVRELGADLQGYLDRYPIAYENEEYRVFAVGE